MDKLGFFRTICISAVCVATCVLLLLTPVLVMFLVPMPKWLSVVVVVVSVFVFAPIVICFSLDKRMATLVVGLSAYMAVLVTILAQF